MEPIFGKNIECIGADDCSCERKEKTKTQSELFSSSAAPDLRFAESSVH